MSDELPSSTFHRLLTTQIWLGDMPAIETGYHPRRVSRWRRLRWWLAAHRVTIHIGPCEVEEDYPDD